MTRRPKRDDRQAEQWRRDQCRTQAMERRFAAAVRMNGAGVLLLRSMLWRARKHYDDHQFEAGDALLEFLPAGTVRDFIEWYFDDEWTGPARPLRQESA